MILSGEEFDPSKHSLDYLEEININYTPTSRITWMNGIILDEMINRLLFDDVDVAVNLFPYISVGNKFIL